MTTCLRRNPGLLVGATFALLLPAVAHAEDGVSTSSDGVTLTTAGGNLELTLGGRLHYDGLSYDENGSNLTTSGFRRARLELSGKIADRIRFRVDREFAGTDGWRNAWVSVRATDDLKITAGNFIVPFAMEGSQSSNSIPLMERSIVSALTPGFGVGVGARYSQRHWTLAGGYFGNALNDEYGRTAERGTGYSGRFTLAPINSRGNLVHFGAGVEDRAYSAGKVAHFQATPGSNFAPTLLGTGGIADPKHLTNIGAEVALSHGPLLFQSQYVTTTLTRNSNPTLNFDGWYAQAGWVVTGQRYRYSRSSGVVSGVRLRPGRRAVEMVARYSELDLNDGAFAHGIGRSMTLGANWYLNENVRLMANYGLSSVKDVPSVPDRDATLVAGRIQVNF